MSVFDQARVWMREARERREEQKAAKPADPPGVTVSEELVRGVKFASWVAYLALMYFLWERVLDVSQAQHSTLEVTHFGIWSNLNLAIFFPLIVGYVFVVIGVPYVAKISIPTLVSLTWREHFWPKMVSLFITLLVSTVLITGTATVGSNAIIESERGAAVAVAEIEQQRTVLERQIERKRAELQTMMDNRNAYLAQAASVGAEEWQRSYIAQTPENDPQRDRIVRALGAARAADAVRADIARLEAQLDGMQTTAAVSSEVVTERTQTLNGVMDFLNTFWVLMLAVVMDLTCLFMPWIAMRLEQKRAAQLGMAGGIPQHPWMLEDHSAEEAIIDTSPREAAKAVFDAGGTREEAEAAAREAAKTRPTRRKYETPDGQDITEYVEKNKKMVRMPRRGKNGKWVADVVVPAGEAEVTVNGKTFTTSGPQNVDRVQNPDGTITEMERGSNQDGGSRIAMTAAGPMEMASVAGQVPDLAGPEPEHAEQSPAADRQDQQQGEQTESVEQQSDDVVQDTPPELSDDEIAAIDAELAADEPQPVEEQPAESQPQEPVEQADADADQRTTPETDPKRMIGVAAE